MLSVLSWSWTFSSRGILKTRPSVLGRPLLQMQPIKCIYCKNAQTGGTAAWALLSLLFMIWVTSLSHVSPVRRTNWSSQSMKCQQIHRSSLFCYTHNKEMYRFYPKQPSLNVMLLFFQFIKLVKSCPVFGVLVSTWSCSQHALSCLGLDLALFRLGYITDRSDRLL